MNGGIEDQRCDDCGQPLGSEGMIIYSPWVWHHEAGMPENEECNNGYSGEGTLHLLCLEERIERKVQVWDLAAMPANEDIIRRAMKTRPKSWGNLRVAEVLVGLMPR